MPQSAWTRDLLYEGLALAVNIASQNLFHDTAKMTPREPGGVKSTLDTGSWCGQERISLVKATPQVGP